MRRAVLVLVGLLFLVPVSTAQTLEQEFQNFHFEKIIFTVTWLDNEGSGAAHVLATAKDMRIEGSAASDLRHCIDGQECRMSALSPASAGADRDGTVSTEEVENFAELIKLGLATRPEVRNFLQNVRGLIRIDDKNATSIALTDLQIDDAEGPVDSTDTIRLSVSAAGKYGTVLPADTHAIWMQRSSTNFTIADRVELRTSGGWRVIEDTIAPDSMVQFYDDGKFEGSQDEFESKDPLVFNIEHHENKAGTYFLWGSVLALLVAAGVGGLIWYRRRMV